MTLGDSDSVATVVSDSCFWAADLKELMTYAFTHMGDFLLILPLLLFGQRPQRADVL